MVQKSLLQPNGNCYYSETEKLAWETDISVRQRYQKARVPCTESGPRQPAAPITSQHRCVLMFPLLSPSLRLVPHAIRERSSVLKREKNHQSHVVRFNGRYPRKSGSACSTWFLSPFVPEENCWRQIAQVLTGRISFPLSDQQCQLPVLAKIFQHYSANQISFTNNTGCLTRSPW